MKILGISGSPHRNGIVSSLVKSTLKGAKEKNNTTKYYNLYDLDLKACNGCMICRNKNTDCPLDDDMDKLLAETDKSDILVIGSPTYWANVSSQTKKFFDRSVSVFLDYSSKIPKPKQDGKKAVLITSCGVSKIIDFFSGQTRGSIKAMKKVLKSAGYKIDSKLKKQDTYNNKKLADKDIEKAVEIGENF
ncbi:MAG: flavodoxin family protein [Candidatus Lokiarchaeota archaeon]|nr:flavodoxin family protein [Candidatus Lokiarchaeota archaeon]MBD3200242.1 flavodoxin family protein [Candidatus Lokiarchaeota archaeon]